MGDPEFKEKIRALFSKVPPYDPRFPNTNQTKNCQVNYLDYLKCMKAKDDEDYCAYYKNAYTALCPPEWVEHYEELRSIGGFPFPEFNDPEAEAAIVRAKQERIEQWKREKEEAELAKKQKK